MVCACLLFVEPTLRRAGPDLVSDDPLAGVRAPNAGAGQPDVREMYRVEGPRLSRFFRERLGSADDVGDLVQEVFVRLLRAPVARTIERPSAYLLRIARNLLFDRTRTAARADVLARSVSLDGVEIPVAPEQTDRLEAEDAMKDLEAALARLPPRTREVFLLHRAAELSYKECAEKLGISVRTVEWHIGEALVQIRRFLDQR